MTGPVRVSVLGATGSVGVSTLDVIANRTPDAPEFSVVALTANTNVEALAKVRDCHARGSRRHRRCVALR